MYKSIAEGWGSVLRCMPSVGFNLGSVGSVRLRGEGGGCFMP